MGMNGMGTNDMDGAAEMPMTDEELPGAIAGEEAAGEPAAATVSLAEYEQVKRERDQVLDRIARLQAEFDNARKREAKERLELAGFCRGAGGGRSAAGAGQLSVGDEGERNAGAV